MQGWLATLFTHKMKKKPEVLNSAAFEKSFEHLENTVLSLGNNSIPMQIPQNEK